jgi:hypothetical protein
MIKRKRAPVAERISEQHPFCPLMPRISSQKGSNRVLLFLFTSGPKQNNNTKITKITQNKGKKL